MTTTATTDDLHQTNAFALRPSEAWRALRRLLADPESTDQVFVIIRALSGKTLLRGFNRFSATPVGRRVLDARIDLLDTLTDREFLRALPAGSLGRTYLAFVERENITADGLVAASSPETAGELALSPALACYAARLRDMHDLWHVTTGYGRDVAGEACLLAFTVAQTRNPALALIALAGATKIARASRSRRIFGAVWQGFSNGRRAQWLPAADWEALLAQPLDVVRESLGIAPPTRYQAMRTAAAGGNTPAGSAAS